MFTLASLVGAGCSSESGASSPRPDAGVDASEGGDAVEPDAEAPDAEVAVACGLVVDPDDVCQACTIAQCCTEAEACAEEPECGQYAPCRAACGEDSTCVDACILTHAAGYVEASLLDGCQATKCNEACGRSPEETCGGALSDETCQSCAQERCCDLLSRFRTSRDGVELSLCELGCPLNDTTCIYDCWGRHEEGFAENLLLTNCLAIECTDTCESLLGFRAPCGLGLDMRGYQGECLSCSEQQCCDEYIERSMSEDFWRGYACTYACKDDVCKDECVQNHIEGIAKSTVAKSCDITSCYEACGMTGSPCGSIYATNTACEACSQQACCDETEALSSDLEGAMYFSCVLNCGWGDRSCASQCIMSYPDGFVLSEIRSDCLSEQCQPCGITGRSCGYDFEDVPDCGSCVEANCCDVSQACGKDFDCRRIEICRYISQCDNDDTACLEACKGENPDGAPLFDDVFDCRMTACAAECASY